MATAEAQSQARTLGRVQARERTWNCPKNSSNTDSRRPPSTDRTREFAAVETAVNHRKSDSCPAGVEIKLMDRANPKAEYNIKPFQKWLAEGWQVRKGEKSIRGLFHQSQCDRIAPKAPAKPAPKAKAKSKPAPATLPLV